MLQDPAKARRLIAVERRNSQDLRLAVSTASLGLLWCDCAIRIPSYRCAGSIPIQPRHAIRNCRWLPVPASNVPNTSQPTPFSIRRAGFCCPEVAARSPCGCRGRIGRSAPPPGAGRAEMRAERGERRCRPAVRLFQIVSPAEPLHAAIPPPGQARRSAREGSGGTWSARLQRSRCEPPPFDERAARKPPDLVCPSRGQHQPRGRRSDAGVKCLTLQAPKTREGARLAP